MKRTRIFLYFLSRDQGHLAASPEETGLIYRLGAIMVK